jgi:hypothetical protein
MTFERHTVAVFMSCKDCIDILSLSLPRLLWADEIIIADASKTSHINEYVHSLSPKIKYYHFTEDNGYKRYLAVEADIESDYVLGVDTDEIFNDQLANEILESLTKPCAYMGFTIPQVNYNYGAQWGGGTPWLKLFKKSDAIIPTQGSYHQTVQVRGPIKPLKNHFVHINNPKLGMTMVKHFRYAAIEAKMMTEESLQIARIDKLNFYKLLIHVFGTILRLNYRFIKYAWLYRRHGYAAICFGYSEIGRVLANDIAPTEEIRMREGSIEMGNRGYF